MWKTPRIMTVGFMQQMPSSIHRHMFSKTRICPQPGQSTKPNVDSGQIHRSTFPSMEDSGTAPNARLSRLCSRLSPMTKTLSTGIRYGMATVPGNVLPAAYGSSRRMPSIQTAPSSMRIVSPGSLFKKEMERLVTNSTGRFRFLPPERFFRKAKKHLPGRTGVWQPVSFFENRRFPVLCRLLVVVSEPEQLGFAPHFADEHHGERRPAFVIAARHRHQRQAGDVDFRNGGRADVFVAVQQRRFLVHLREEEGIQLVFVHDAVENLEQAGTGFEKPGQVRRAVRIGQIVAVSVEN